MPSLSSTEVLALAGAACGFIAQWLLFDRVLLVCVGHIAFQGLLVKYIYVITRLIDSYPEQLSCSLISQLCIK
jgi:hypothetical protein